jgi:hypothetical protein
MRAWLGYRLLELHRELLGGLRTGGGDAEPVGDLHEAEIGTAQVELGFGLLASGAGTNPFELHVEDRV